MAIRFRSRDAQAPALDLWELGKKHHGGMKKPPEAVPAHDPARAARVRLPWTYDLDYGWTPKREKEDPRPPLQLPPYYNERFTFNTAWMGPSIRTLVFADLRRFPRQARVFLWLPASAVRPARLAELQQGLAQAPDGRHASVPASIADYNALFGESEPAAVQAGRVLVELEPAQRVLLDQLQLTSTPVELEVRYLVDRGAVRPKSEHVILFTQMVDGYVVGEFEHIFQAYHPYDIPVIGDRRTFLAYRRSSREVSTIPPLALQFFDSWERAASCGYDPAMRNFGRHFRPVDVSPRLRGFVLELFNDPHATALGLSRRIVDNPQVGSKGIPEASPKKKLGLTPARAQLVLEARNRLPGRRFATLEQVDRVHGIGPDTMSDIITSFLVARDEDPHWRPDLRKLALLKG